MRSPPITWIPSWCRLGAFARQRMLPPPTVRSCTPPRDLDAVGRDCMISRRPIRPVQPGWRCTASSRRRLPQTARVIVTLTEVEVDLRRRTSTCGRPGRRSSRPRASRRARGSRRRRRQRRRRSRVGLQGSRARERRRSGAEAAAVRSASGTGAGATSAARRRRSSSRSSSPVAPARRAPGRSARAAGPRTRTCEQRARPRDEQRDRRDDGDGDEAGDAAPARRRAGTG